MRITEINIKKEDLYQLYIVEKLKTKTIANKYNCTVRTIFKKLEKFQIKRKKLVGKYNHGWTGYEEISGTFWDNIKKNAKKRKLKFDIDIKYVWKLYLEQNKRCAISGIIIYFSPTLTQHQNGYTTASLDRIDSTLGYIKGNVQWVHKDINALKSNYKQKYFIELCHAVSNNNFRK